MQSTVGERKLAPDNFAISGIGVRLTHGRNVKLRLLPSSFEHDGSASAKQHLTCFIVNGRVALDAGSLAMGLSQQEGREVRDIVLSHAHLDHVAGLPLFLDDHFATLTEPIRVHAAETVIEVLERDIFNWSVYPRFSELRNANGPVIEYVPFSNGVEFVAGGLRIRPLSVNHKVPSSGFLINDGESQIALTGDTSAMRDFWSALENVARLDALLIECAFPNELSELAGMSHHLTPSALATELETFGRTECPKYVVNIKPAYQAQVVREIEGLKIENLQILEVGQTYVW
jgi:ribonuclease BN (tRNA processing enzyme)